MLAIKLILVGIACIIGLVYIIALAMVASGDNRKSYKIMYGTMLVWMAFGEAFFIGYMVKLIGGIR